MHINEYLYFNELGDLYPMDVRHSPSERSLFDPMPDGQIRMRVKTEPVFNEIIVVYYDVNLKTENLSLWAETVRFQYWVGTIKPLTTNFRYHIALKRTDGSVAYYGPTGTTGAAEFYFHVDLGKATLLETPKWMQGAVMYQIFPERFANGDTTNDPTNKVSWGSLPKSFEFQGGDLIGVRNKIDYLHDLGVDVLYLNPIFSSPSNHKYDCADYYQVDPSFGGNQALADLVEALHRRGMKIILDASFNHCYPNFFAFKDIINNGPTSKYWDWFTIYEYPLKVRVRPHMFPSDMQQRTDEFLSWFKSFEESTGIQVITVDDDGSMMEPTYKSWMGVLSMPTINLNNPETRQYFLEVSSFWIDKYKIDGWRMDVVPFVSPDFWNDFRLATKGTNPNTILLSEVWGNASYWLQGERFDGTMNYTFRWLALGYFAKANMDTQTFIDGCREMLMMYGWDNTQVSQNLLSSHDTPRFLNLAGEDIIRFRLASIFQLTMPGAPSIYYGDEIGMSGGSDPDNRRAFPWEKQDVWDFETFELIRTLIQLRKQYPVLRYGDWEVVWSNQEAFAYRRFDDQHQVLIVISRKTAMENILIPIQTKIINSIFGRVEFELHENGILIKHLASWSGAVFSI